MGIRGHLPAGAALLLSLALFAPTAAASAEGPLFGPTSPRFAADLATSLDSTGESTLQVEIQVPYTECQFVRVPAGLGAGLEFLVVVRDGRGRQVTGDAWEQRFVVATFEETKEGSARVAAARSFRVTPGKHRVLIRVRDVNGGLASEVEAHLAVAGMGKQTLALGDLVFGECAPDSDSASAAATFAPNAARRYVDDLRRFCVRSSLLDLLPGAESRRYRVRFQVRDDRGVAMVSGDTLLAGKEARPFVLRPDVTGLFLGPYALEVVVEEGGRRWKTEGSFEVEAVTVPQGHQWDMAVEILEYVASPGEQEGLRKAESPEERKRRWEEFWGRRDPTPDTPRNEALIEFLRRVRYVNAQFSGPEPGWRTDRGRIYIGYGPPDQIEDLPATQTNPPLQVWHYLSLNRRFIFADRTGFGRYELMNQGGL